MSQPPEDILERLLVARLPSPPQTLIRLMSLCQSDDVGMAELSELIASDPGLASKVLSVAHSAAYHRTNAKTLTLLQATSTLGMGLIKVLVISESVFQTFNAFRQAGGVNLQYFWKHSLKVAVLARAMAERQSGVSSEEAYLAGLLHDVGRLALLAAIPERYTELFGQPDNAGLCNQEQRLLGMSHAQAGAWLLEHWHLNDAMVDAVLSHHDDVPPLKDTRPLARSVHLAHRLAALPLNKPFDNAPDILEQDLTLSEIAALVQKAALQVAQIARDLGVDISDTDSPPTAGQVITRPQPLDATQTQLAQEVLNRSVLNEMAMTLINMTSTNAALTSLRQHASALLQLEDAMVMLARDNQQTLVPVSMNERHLDATPLSFDLALDAPMLQCVSQRKVVFSKRTGASTSILLDVMHADEVVLLPLLTAQHCLGVLAAVVAPEYSHHLKTQLPTLQAFGVYAGLALSRRRLAEKKRPVQNISAKEAQQLELKRVAQAVNLLVESLSKTTQAVVMAPVELSLAVRDIVQLLQHRQLIPGNIEINSELPNRASWVQSSLGMVKQILLILIKNACESMPDGGQIVINGGVLVQREGAVYTALTVSDSGPSLKEAVQAQLYEPMHTAERDESELHRYGLSMVNHLVEKMDGHLKFNASATGTKFEILLPCARNPTV
ncbi:HDOD domain-containing protein [Rhodoferax sp.]|uniref:HDOD domain-containing protein n=1 Tax=Rhodoferax sp. TaxID=50421 RepID=UPI00283D9D25|nr:HDOD domain-containing protein [Rhodoferax sp.]MDR3368392.1 HDOD domain-containing protein [Rhodoferax sp.]